MAENTNTEREANGPAEVWLRSRYGAYRGHFAWRELEEAFNAGRASLSLPAAGQEPVELVEEIMNLARTLEGKAFTAATQYARENDFNGDRSSDQCDEIKKQMRAKLYAALAAPQPAVAAGWMPIESAPKDGTPIIGYCMHSADAYYEKFGDRLTDYGARAEGMSHVDDGPHVLVWDAAYDVTDGWEMPASTVPAWWTLSQDQEVAANPTHWMPLPPAPSTEGEGNG